ncbi:MAG: hypothetical protein O2895_04160, partial [Chloroflexi bacterium]|nr:hypothetical protein [Chloroflexota bacterium]
TAAQLRSRAAQPALADLDAEIAEAAWERQNRIAVSAAGSAGNQAGNQAQRDEAQRDDAQRDEALRKAALARARQYLAEDWDALSYEVRRALLREVVAAVVVTDDELRVELAS